jgi:hypothetical protein
MKAHPRRPVMLERDNKATKEAANPPVTIVGKAVPRE